MQSLEPSLSNTEAEVAILFIEHLMSNLDIKTVMVVTEAAKSADIKPKDVEVINQGNIDTGLEEGTHPNEITFTSPISNGLKHLVFFVFCWWCYSLANEHTMECYALNWAFRGRGRNCRNL